MNTNDNCLGWWGAVDTARRGHCRPKICFKGQLSILHPPPLLPFFQFLCIWFRIQEHIFCLTKIITNSWSGLFFVRMVGNAPVTSLVTSNYMYHASQQRPTTLAQSQMLKNSDNFFMQLYRFYFFHMKRIYRVYYTKVLI